MVTLVELPGLACPYCGRTATPETPWVAAAAARWGWCGVKLCVDEQVAGILLLAPAEETGEAMLMCTWVRPESVRSGYGKQLVQAAAAGLVARNGRMIIARSGRRPLRCSAPPRDFLRAVGFTRGIEDRLWRLDLDRAVEERPRVRGVLNRFMDSLRPISPPEPAGGAISGSVTRSST